MTPVPGSGLTAAIKAALVAAFLFAAPVFAATIPATDATLSVAAAARPGDTVVLTGPVSKSLPFSNKTFSPRLVIDATAATFTGPQTLSNAVGLDLIGGTYTAEMALRLNSTSDVTIRGATFAGPGTDISIAMKLATAKNLQVLDTTVKGYGIGISGSALDGFRFSGLQMDNLTHDGMVLNGAQNGEIDHNRLWLHGPTIPGVHVDMIQGIKPWVNVSVHDNDVRGNGQGIFLGGTGGSGVYSGNAFYNNHVESLFTNGLALYDNIDYTLHDNDIHTIPGALYRSTITVIGGNALVPRCGNTVDAYAGKLAIREAACFVAPPPVVVVPPTPLEVAEAEVARLTLALAQNVAQLSIAQSELAAEKAVHASDLQTLGTVQGDLGTAQAALATAEASILTLTGERDVAVAAQAAQRGVLDQIGALAK